MKDSVKLVLQVVAILVSVSLVLIIGWGLVNNNDETLNSSEPYNETISGFRPNHAPTVTAIVIVFVILYVLVLGNLVPDELRSVNSVLDNVKEKIESRLDAYDERISKYDVSGCSYEDKLEVLNLIGKKRGLLEAWNIIKKEGGRED